MNLIREIDNEFGDDLAGATQMDFNKIKIPFKMSIANRS